MTRVELVISGAISFASGKAIELGFIYSEMLVTLSIFGIAYFVTNKYRYLWHKQRPKTSRTQLTATQPKS